MPHANTLEGGDILRFKRWAGHKHCVHVGDGVFHIGEPRQKLTLHDAKARASIGEHMGEEPPFVSCVDAHVHRADAIQPKPRPQVFQTVVQHHRHVVPERHALLAEGVTDAVGHFVCLSIGIRLAIFILHKGLITSLTSLLGENLAHNPSGLVGGHKAFSYGRKVLESFCPLLLSPFC
jgi:hypothetical protein